MQTDSMNVSSVSRAATAPAWVAKPAVPFASRFWWREALAACGPFEWLTFSYLAWLNTLLVLFRQNLPHAAAYFFLHLTVGAGVLTLVGATEKHANRVLHWVRHWYPLALFLFFFEELHHLVHLIFPVWFDRGLMQFDYAVLGAHPTVWLEQFASPALNDAMQFAYMTYYFYTVLIGGVLYWRKQWEAFWQVMTATALAYYLGYAISVLFPIEGPYHTLAALQRGELTGGFFTAVMNVVEGFGRVHGAAFPSAHVSGATVALLGAWRYRRALFWLFLPFYLAMLVSTVYGRYHYVADVLAGIVVGAMGFRLVSVAGWSRYFGASAARASNARNASIA